MYNHQKEKIYLPQAAIALLKTPDAQSPNSNEPSKKGLGSEVQNESRATSESFLEYLDSWQKRATNIDISENLKSAVTKVQDFPENSYAFCVGVGQLFKIASAEVLDTATQVSKIIEDSGTVNDLNEYCRKGGNIFLTYLEPIYDRVSNSLSNISKQILGEEIHDSVSSFFEQYLKPLADFVMNQLQKLLKAMAEEKPEVSEYKDTSSLAKIDLNYSSQTEKDGDKEDLLNELAHRSSDFLNHSKDFFAHNILDRDNDGYNALTPEILVEGDIKSRPIYDPLPPAWVVSEKHKDQDQVAEYKRAFGESAPMDSLNGELSNLAKLNLLNKPKVI